MKSIFLSILIGLFALVSICESQTIVLTPLSWSYGYVDIPSSTEPILMFTATNYTATGIVDLYTRLFNLPTQTSFDSMTSLTIVTGGIGNSGLYLWSSVTFPGPGPVKADDNPYYFALRNESDRPQTIYITSNFGSVTTVPEPATIAFFGLAFLMLLVYSRRWKA